MNFKTIFAVLGLSTIALGKAVNTSYTTIPTSNGNVPKELMSLFNYEVGDEMLVGGLIRSCIVDYYNKYCNDDSSSNKVDKSKLKIMKKEIDMGGKSQKQVCKIIKETCDMIDPNYNPLTGEGMTEATLYTPSGKKVPARLARIFNYRVGRDDDSQRTVSYKSKDLYYIYEENCGDSYHTIDKEKESTAYENFPIYTQEEVCDIIKELDGMLSASYNPLTGEALGDQDLHTPSGEKVPEELLNLFDYEVGDEMLVGGLRRSCIVDYYHKYCNDDSESNKVDKSKLNIMKKEIDMGGKSQKQVCKIIKETCDMIDSDYNPYTGYGISRAELYSKNGKIPTKMMHVFQYSVDDEMEASIYIRGCYDTYSRVCSEEFGEIDESKKDEFNNYFYYDGRSQKELCPIVKDTCEMINVYHNPLSGDSKSKTIEVNN